MLKYFKVVTLFLVFAAIFSDIAAQQNVFSRDNVSTGNWGDAQNPWYYGLDNTNRGDPDHNITPNFIRFGHNNNLNMTLNGRSYQARWVIFEPGASSARIIDGENLNMSPNNGNCKIENQSTANHTFINNIALFATTEFNPVNGNLTFNGNIFTNGNFIDVFGNNGNELLINGGISGASGLAVKENSTVRFVGNQTYTGGTFVEDGKLSLEGAAGTNTITGNITLSGGDLEYGNVNDEQISNSSNVTITSGTWNVGAIEETINDITLTSGELIKGSEKLIVNGAGYIGTATLTILSGTASLEFNSILELGGAFANYNASSTAAATIRITSDLITTFGTTQLVNTGGGTPFINLNGTNQMFNISNGTTLDSDWGFRVGGLTKTGAGTLIMRAASTYSDPTVIEEGVILYETINAIDDDSDLVLNGGSLNVNGFSDDLAEFDVNSNSTITLGAGNHTLRFENSSLVSWDGSATLTIENWQGTAGLSGTEGKIFVGNDDTGLTPAQLAQISFDGYPSPAELLPTGELVPSALDVTLFDTFNRTDSDNVGPPSSGGANWTETEGAPAGARILDDALRLQRGASGRDFVSYDMSALYETAYDGSTTNTEWRFNMRTNRPNPSGFNDNNYGVAYVLGSNESDFLSADAFGYAVVIGETGADPVRLVKFTDGLDLTSNLSSIANVSGNPPDSFFSIVVTYESCSNTWSLTARDDGGAFANPTTGNFPAAVTGVDNEFTFVDLDFMGALWNHGTASTSFAEFDNFYVPNTSFDAEYTWSGTVDTDYQDPANWTPARDCPRGRDRLVFNGSGIVAVTNVPDQERIGQWILSSTIDLRVEDDPNTSAEPDVPSEITLTGGTGEDFLIPESTTMRFDCGSTDPEDALQFLLNTDVTGDIDGTVIFQRTNSGSGPRHALIALDANAIDISGTILANELRSGWEPFGESGSPGSVIFQSGAVYDGSEGGSPFGDSGQPAQAVFNSGSTYIHRGNHSFQTGGRTYANFEYRNPEVNPQTLLFGSNNIWTMEDFRVLDGTLILSGTNNLPFNINISGDFEVGIDGTFNYAPTGALPASASTFNFNGSSPQTISFDGTLVFNNRVTLELNNTYNSPGFALEIQNDIELFNDFLIQDGEVQGEGATITMSGTNTTLSVDDNGSIYGSDVGVGQNLSLISNDPLLTLSGGTSSVCRFFDLTINNNLEFVVDRPLLEVQFGTFTIGDGSILRLNTAGQAILGSSVGPIYGVNSQLIYNSGATTQRGAEWSSTSGAGYPVDVTIQNGTTVEVTNSVGTDYGIQGDLNIGNAVNGDGTLTMTDVTNFLQIDGDVNIGDGVAAGTLTLSSQVGGDIRLRGNWNNAGTFDSNDRAVFFNGSTEQIINTTSVTVEVMDYLIIDNSSAQGVLLGGSFTELEVRGTPGNNALEIYDGDLNLNGKSLYLGRNGNATGVLIGSQPIQIFSASPTFFNFEGTGSKVISSSLGGSLEFDDQITVTISSGVDFGPSLTTVNATLELQAGSFVNGNAPIYGPDGTLVYNTGGFYNRRVEWDGTEGSAGYPNDVIIRDGCSVTAPGENSSFNNTALELRRDLTIEEGATLFMDLTGNGMEVPLVVGRNLILNGVLQGSDRVGGDIEILGNWNQAPSGVYTPNARQVRFAGTTAQTIDAPVNTEFAFVQVNNPSGVSIENDIRVTDIFDFTDGIVTPDSDDLDGTEKIIFTSGSGVGAVSNDSHYQGIVVKEGDTEFVFPVGDTSSLDMTTFLYQPVRIFDLAGNTSIEVQYFAEPHPEAGPWYDGSIGANGELEEVGNCDYWIVNKTNLGAPDAKVSFRYTNSEPIYCNDVGDINTLTIASFNGFEWDPVAPNISAFTDEISSISVIDEIAGGGTDGSYGPFTFRSTNGADNFLPITLISFHAEAKEGLVHTNWVTASEINNDYFTVERSKDGSSWEKVGTVEGAGDSNMELTYAFVDDDPYSGISYYRLRQTDFDGTTTVSEIRAVEILQGSSFGLDKVYRGQDGLNLVYRSTAPYVVVEIYDLLGKRIHGELLENYGNGFATIHPDLARGAYVLRLSHGSETDAEKFVW